jgi:hypothetical protein
MNTGKWLKTTSRSLSAAAFLFRQTSIYTKTTHLDRNKQFTEYRTYFSQGEKLQTRLLIPRKRWGSLASTCHQDANIRKIQRVTDVTGDGLSRRIRVSGGRYQLSDGLVVECGF